jgi:hypothetical protein
LAVYTGQAAHVLLRCLHPLLRPILQRLAAQKPQLLDKPLFRRVRLVEVSVRVPHRAHDRRQPLAKTWVGLKKGQQGFVAEFHCCHGFDSLNVES